MSAQKYSSICVSHSINTHILNKDLLVCVCGQGIVFCLYLPNHLSRQVPEHIQRHCIIGIGLFALAQIITIF